MRHTRRAFLGATAIVATLGLSGCPASTRATPPATTSSAPPDPLAPVLAAQVALRSQYDAAFIAVPALVAEVRLGATLATLRDEVDRHVTATAAAMAVVPPASSGADPSTTSSGASPTTSAAPVAPPDAASLLAALLAAESALGAALVALVPTVAVERAPLVGSMSASTACHVVVLT